MSKLLFKVGAALLITMVSILNLSGQSLPSSKLQINPWSNSQLLPPATLAKMIEKGQKVRVYNIGVMENIPGAVLLGAASEKQNLAKLGNVLKGLPKNETIVLYCGCCPMDKCPNIRPAFQMLKDQKFAKPFLLNLPVNLKTDWTDKGYPMAKSSK